MGDLLEQLTIDELPEEQKAFAEVIGIEKYREVCRVFGGDHLYILSPDTLTRSRRDAQIYSLFDGGNFRALAARFNMTTAQVRNIVNQQRKRANNKEKIHE